MGKLTSSSLFNKPMIKRKAVQKSGTKTYFSREINVSCIFFPSKDEMSLLKIVSFY